MRDNFPEGSDTVKLQAKYALLGALVLLAGVSAAGALGGIQQNAPPTPTVYTYEWNCSMEEAAFVLRESDGYVGVFESAGARKPVTVTDIEVAGLRDADRDMLSAGIAVCDRQELLSLLEDFGS